MFVVNRTPSQADVIRAALEHRLAGLHVCLPGEVVSYDVTKQSADIKLSLKNIIESETGEEALEYPVIPDVPICFPRAGAWFIHFPISPGDHMLVLFSERSIDQFRSLGGTQDPLDLRKHDLSDAVALPASLVPDASVLAGVANDHLTVGKSGGSTIHINADGTIGLGSAVPADAAATALKVATELQQFTTIFLTPLNTIPAAIDLASALTAINAVLVGAKALLLTGWPHDVGSTKVRVDP